MMTTRTKPLHIYFKKRKGQSLVELMVVIGLMAVLIPALYGLFISVRQSIPQRQKRNQAYQLLMESEEITRNLREKGWSTISSPAVAYGSPYYPVSSGNGWGLSAGTESINGFSRSSVFSQVNRNTTTGAIVPSGGQIDPATRKVVHTISWTAPYASSLTSTQYFTRNQNQTQFLHDLTADFSGGTFSNTTATANSVQLTAIANTLWSAPSLVSSYNISGNSDSVSVIVSGNYAYVGLPDNGNTVDFVVFDISTPTSILQVGAIDTASNVNGVTISGNYAYLATSSNSRELTVVDVTNKSTPTIVGSLDLSSNVDAKAIAVAGTTAYLTRYGSNGNAEFYSINIATPTLPVLLGSYDPGNVDMNALEISGNYVYVATSSNTQEVIAVNITAPASPSFASSFDLPSSSDASTVTISGTTLFVGTRSNASGSELYTLSISNPLSISQIGSLEIGDNVNSIAISGTKAILGTAVTGAAFRIVDISTLSSLIAGPTLSLGGTVYAVYVLGSYAFVGNINNAQEFQIVGAGGSSGGYQTSGTFESVTLDATASSVFDYLSLVVSEPSSTDVKLQIAISETNPPTNYFGPDGTAGTYFQTPIAIPFWLSEGRYLRYKATFSGDGTSTPVLDSVQITYSP